MKRKKLICRLLAYAVIVSMLLCGVGKNAAAAKMPKLSHSKLTLMVGKKAALKVVYPAKKVTKISYKSSKKTVASVTAKGKVTAKKQGKARITCKVVLKNGKKYTLYCEVLVKAKKENQSESSTRKPVETKQPVPDSEEEPSSTPEATKQPEPAPEEKPSSTPEATKQPEETVAPTQEPNPTATPTPERTDIPAALHNSRNDIATIDNGIMRSYLNAFDFVDAMGNGINLGNTMESCGTWINSSSVTNYETAWGAPVTTREMFAGMKKAGFQSVRIPVAWSNMMKEDGSYRISEEYFDRIETIMNYAFSERMYVIINIHYDSGWWAKFGSKNEEEREQAMEKYKSIWEQIANRYQEYSDYLIFESANEELGSRLNSTSDYSGSGYFTTEKELYEKTNEINQTFVDVVRASGGNNATRFLLIAGYDTDIDKTCNIRFKMPKDTVDSRLLVSIHCYSPAIYCIADNPDNSWGFQDSWGTEEDISTLENQLKKMKINFVDKGFPVIIGEYGVTDKKVGETFYRKQGRELYYRTVCKYALQNGMCPMLWDTGGTFDRRNCLIKEKTEADVYLEMQTLAESTSPFVPK